MLFVVTYPKTDTGTFDTAYYLDTHMPLVREHWTQYGLIRAQAVIPDEPTPAYAAIALLEFGSAADLDAALASSEAATVFGDVPNFTNLTPVPVRGNAH